VHTITVTGTGSSTVAPDTAMVRVAAVARGARVADTYDAVARAAASVVAVAERHTEPATDRLDGQHAVAHA
jgi:uncharacterized protein